jgi:hypothetical protein
LEIPLRGVLACKFIYETVHSGLGFREEVKVGPKHWSLQESLKNFILLDLLELKTWKECMGKRSKIARCDKLAAGRAKHLWYLIYLLPLLGILHIAQKGSEICEKIKYVMKFLIFSYIKYQHLFAANS